MEKTKESKTVENRDLLECLVFLKSVKELSDEQKTKRIFETVEEAELEAIENIQGTINETVSRQKQEISDLQKAGNNLSLEGIKLIKIPLKSKVWTSTLRKKDLEEIFKTLEEVQKKIDPIKKGQEEKDTKKEMLEKEREEKEKLAEEAKTTSKEKESKDSPKEPEKKDDSSKEEPEKKV